MLCLAMTEGLDITKVSHLCRLWGHNMESLCGNRFRDYKSWDVQRDGKVMTSFKLSF